MSDTIDLSEYIDKIVYAQKDTPLYRHYSDDAKGHKIFTKVYTAKKGERIGKVYSWIGPAENTNHKVYLMFQDTSLNPKSKWYFIEYEDGSSIDQRKLKEQGAKTDKEKQEEKEAKDKSWMEKLGKGLKPFAWGVVVIYGVKTAVEAYQNNRSSK